MVKNMQVRTIEYQSEDYTKEVALRDEVLRKPIGRSIYTEDLSHEDRVVHIGAFMNDQLVGTMYLRPLDELSFQIKQVAVRDVYRGHNIGRLLMDFTENLAKSMGGRKLVLDSRATAVGFYEKLGFENTGVEVQYFDLPHLKMSKII